MKISTELQEIYEEIEKEKRRNIYEAFCDFSYNLVRFKFDENKLKKEERVIAFSGLKIPPTSNISASVIFFLFSFLAIFLISMAFGFSYFPYLFLMAGFFTFLIYYYPYLMMKIIRAQASSEMVLCVTYMVISLSQVPNLENAVVFAYKNLKGPIKKDLEKILADFITHKIFTFEEGLNKVIDKWYVEAKEFSEALRLLVTYSAGSYKGEKLLEEAINLTVDGSYQRMEKYARELKLPATAILVLGIILPVIGLTLIPMMTIFLPELLNIAAVFFIYNLFLPTILFILVMLVIEGRPLTTSSIKLEDSFFSFKILDKKINMFPILAALAIFLFIVFGRMIYFDIKNYQMCSSWMNANFAPASKPENLQLNIDECKNLMSDLIGSVIKPSLLLIFSVVLFTLPLFLLTYKIMERMKKIRQIESELGTVLLQISQKVNVGTPFEKVILSFTGKFQAFEIEEMFENLKENLLLGKSLKDAFFEEKAGIANKYNSSLLTSVFRIIVDISSKGALYLSDALATISRYLQTLSNLQNKIEDLIAENVSTIKFMSFFLNPIVAGVAVSLGMIIMGILTTLSITMGNIMPQEVSGIPSIGLPMLNIWKASSIPPSLFQLVIGIYLIEVSIISGILMVGLETGFDNIAMMNTISKILLFATFLFLIISIVIYISLSGLAVSIFEISK